MTWMWWSTSGTRRAATDCCTNTHVPQERTIDGICKAVECWQLGDRAGDPAHRHRRDPLPSTRMGEAADSLGAVLRALPRPGAHRIASFVSHRVRLGLRLLPAAGAGRRDALGRSLLLLQHPGGVGAGTSLRLLRPRR